MQLITAMGLTSTLSYFNWPCWTESRVVWGSGPTLELSGAKGSSRVFPPQFSLMNGVLSRPCFSEPTCPQGPVEGQVSVLGMDSAAQLQRLCSCSHPCEAPVGADTETLGKWQRKAKEKTPLSIEGLPDFQGSWHWLAQVIKSQPASGKIG